jgi:hypothetical protein
VRCRRAIKRDSREKEMAYTSKHGKLVKSWPKVGEAIHTDVGLGSDGKFYWRESRDPATKHGPFNTQAEADQNCRVTIFGPECEFSHGGQWDPAWEKKQ